MRLVTGSSIISEFVYALESTTLGTLTQAQEDAILSSMQGIGNGGLKTALDGLVAAGTITQEQEDAVLNAMQGTGMTGNHGSMQGTGMTGNHGSNQGKGMMSNRGSMSR